LSSDIHKYFSPQALAWKGFEGFLANTNYGTAAKARRYEIVQFSTWPKNVNPQKKAPFRGALIAFNG